MNDEQQMPPTSSLGPQDLIFILFRHKFKILFFLLVGIAAAALVFNTHQPVYRSAAKLLIRYVTDSRALASSPDAQEVVRSPDTYNSTVINSEIEILRSRDLARLTARRMGPDKILAAYGGGSDEAEAAGLLMQNMIVDVGRNSAVMNVTLSHRDPAIARDSLKIWIAAYLERHIEIHRSIGTYDLIQSQADQLRVSLNEAEEQLRAEKSRANVVSIEQTREELGARLAALKTAYSVTDTEIAQGRARIEAYLGRNSASTNVMANATAVAASRPDRTETEPAEGAIDPKVIAEYQRLSAYLNTLRNREIEFREIYSPEGQMVQQVRDQIVQTEKTIAALGVDPEILNRQAPVLNAAQPAAAGIVFDINHERRQLVALEAKLQNLKTQIDNAQEEGRKLDAAEHTIVALQRKRDTLLEQSRNLERSLDRARVDQTLDAGKINNISPVQEPTISTRDTSTLQKLLLIAFGAPTGFGLALAFALEMFLDPSIKRAKELENKLGVRLYATVPMMGRNGKALRKLKNGGSGESIVPGLRGSEIAPWDEQDPMMPYYEALRDRIVMSYAGDPHRPKIVGLTSCDHGAGVTRLSTGLAAALSRDAQRNVLFIALEKSRVTVSAFSKGRPMQEEQNNGSEVNGGDQHVIEENLQSLTTTGRNLAGASIVQSFTDLLPRLRASEYDYVIFDLPPLTQTSGALRLAAQMERTVLVVEAEKTKKDCVRRAKDLLGTSGKEIVTVFNKAKTYGSVLAKEDI